MDGTMSATMRSMIASTLAMLALLVMSPAQADRAVVRGSITNVVFLGDSIVQGIVPGDSYPKQFAQMCGEDCSVTNLAQSGSCVATGEPACIEDPLVKLFREKMKGQHPDWIVIGIGRNDLCETSDFRMKRAFKKVIRMGQKMGARVTISTIIPVGETWWKDCTDQMMRMNEWIRTRNDYVDQYAAMTNPVTNRLYPWHVDDGIHPNEAGSTVLARTLMSVMN